MEQEPRRAPTKTNVMRRTILGLAFVAAAACLPASASHPYLTYSEVHATPDGYVAVDVVQWVPVHEPVDWALCAVGDYGSEDCFPDVAAAVDCIANGGSHCATRTTVEMWRETNQRPGLQRTPTCPEGGPVPAEGCAEGRTPIPADTRERRIASP